MADEPPKETKRPENFPGLFSAYSPIDFILARQNLFLPITIMIANNKVSVGVAPPEVGGFNEREIGEK